MMNTNARNITASLVSALAILLVPLLLGAFTVYEYHTGGADLMDDTPIRSAGILFVLIPIVYPILAILVFVLTRLLGKLHLLSKQSLAIVVVTLSIILGLFLGLQSPFGVKDQLIGIGVFTLLSTICIGLGATTWWLIAKPKHNKSVEQTA